MECNIDSNSVIVISITVHTSVECVIDLVENVRYFFRLQPHIIIVHANLAMYPLLLQRTETFGRSPKLTIEPPPNAATSTTSTDADDEKEEKGEEREEKEEEKEKETETDRRRSIILLNDEPFNKGWAKFSILNGHLCNHEYLVKHGYRYDYLIPLASNCLFIKTFDLNCKEQLAHFNTELHGGKPKWCLPQDIEMITDPEFIHSRRNYWWWGQILKNRKIMRVLSKDGVDLYCQQHEGLVIERPVFANIVEYIRTNRIKELIEHNTLFEEFLLISLYRHFAKHNCHCLCKNNYGDAPSAILNLLAKRPSIFCVKKVGRTRNNPVRLWLREQSNDYKLE